MSMVQWVCEGIGFEQRALLPFLDGKKLADLLNEDPDFAPEDGELEKEFAFSSLDNKAQVDVLMDYYIHNVDEQLPELLLAKDEKTALVCANDNEGQYFLLYPPGYPWSHSGDFKSQEEVVRYIGELVLPYCLDGVTLSEIMGAVDPDVFVVGAG